MRKILFMLITGSICLTSCKKEEKDLSPEKYLSTTQKDSLIVDLMMYVAPKPDTTEHPKGSPSLRPFYIERMSFYDLICYYPKEDSTFYFLLSQKAPSAFGEKAGIGGYFKKKSRCVSELEEVFITYKMKAEDLKKNGKILMDELIENGNVDKYIKEKNYIEFPDERNYYDKESNSWKIKPISAK